MLASDRATVDDGRTETACWRPDSDPRLRVSVLFTTPEATLFTLRKAAALTAQMQARIVLIAAESVPFRISLGLSKIGL